MNPEIVIIGAGESGVGAAMLAKQKGFDVFVSDNGIIKDKYKNVLSQFDIKFEEGKHSDALILKADRVIKSPGVPEKGLISRVREKGIDLVSEIEFAGEFTTAKKICVTGSNGKTTTSSLIWHIMKNAGMNAGLAGNIGNSFAAMVANEQHDYYVLEISSFQLDDMYRFKADIAVLLNITPDHLDRYDYDFQKYVDSKFRIIRNQNAEDHFIFCADDQVIESEMKKRIIPAKKYPFSIVKKINGDGAFIENENIQININSNKLTMTLQTLALQGKHNLFDSMAAGIAGRILDIRKEDVQKSLADFQNIEHRLEYVISVHCIEFINDSKATNVNSTWYALDSMSKPVIWIAGGQDKGNDYNFLLELVRKKVKAIVCLGKDNSKLHKMFADHVETIINAGSMSEAVWQSYLIGNPGDVVLLSPACASFDLFENYEDRGRQFKKLVREL